MHAHGLLLTAAAGLIWLFGGLVLGLTWLLRTGRLRDPEGRVSLAACGPVLAGALSGGAAAVHGGLAGAHAATAMATASAPIAFLCSVGAGPTHYGTVDASAAGLLPLGILSLGLIPAQAVWARPAFWRRRRLAVAGLAVTALAIGVAAARTLLAPVIGPGAGALAGLPGQPIGRGTLAMAIPSAALTDWLALAFEVSLVALVGTLIWGRGRRLAERIEVRRLDAWLLTGMAVGGVAVLAGVSLLADHSPA